MKEPESNTRGFLKFWTTIPGILTGLAALLSAGAGIFVTSTEESPSAQPIFIVNLDSETAAARPSTFSQVPSNELHLNDSIQAANADIQATIDGCAAGDSYACATLLNALAQECEAGYGLSCDVLSHMSPVGTEYEYYGQTCGYRISGYAGRCNEL